MLLVAFKKKMLEQGRWESLKERYKLLDEDRDDNVYGKYFI